MCRQQFHRTRIACLQARHEEQSAIFSMQKSHSIPGCWEDPEVIMCDGSPMEEYRTIHIFIRFLCVVHFSHLAEFTSGVLMYRSDYLDD